MLFTRQIKLLLLTASSALAMNLASRSRRPTEEADWMEAMADFKSLVRAVTFGENVPRHQESPLQLNNDIGMFILTAANEIPHELPKKPAKKTWKGSKRLMAKKANWKGTEKLLAKKNWKGTEKLMAKRASSQSNDELAFLNFLVQQEEPSQRVKADLKKANERYRAIVKERKSNVNKKSNASKAQSQSKNKKEGKSKFFDRLDLKGVRNKLTISVAFAVIVTALFCVVVQLFRLFVRPSSSSSRGGFDQLNRRSNAAYGYERIALDVDEEDEAVPLNA